MICVFILIKTVKKIQKILRNCGPNIKEKTWTTKPFDLNGFKATGLNWRLDYIFATKDLKVTNSQIIKTEYSDHLPLIVEFEV